MPPPARAYPDWGFSLTGWGGHKVATSSGCVASVYYDGNYTYGPGPKGEYRGRTTPFGSFKGEHVKLSSDKYKSLRTSH